MAWDEVPERRGFARLAERVGMVATLAVVLIAKAALIYDLWRWFAG